MLGIPRLEVIWIYALLSLSYRVTGSKGLRILFWDPIRLKDFLSRNRLLLGSSVVWTMKRRQSMQCFYLVLKRRIEFSNLDVDVIINKF